MSNPYKKLGANMFLFAISSFGTKLIGFLLIPMYTNWLTTEEYGIADMLNTAVQLVVPIFSVDIADAVIRFLLEKKQERISVLYIALRVILIGSVILFLLILGLKQFGIIFIPNKYYGFIFISFALTSMYNIFVNFFKGNEHVRNIVFAGLICSLVNASCNILFLTKFNMGVDGYLMANLLSIAISLAYFLFCSFNYGYIKLNYIQNNRYAEKEMLIYSAPLVLNGLGWWVNNSLDRMFVTLMLGIGANGLLAVAYKIPSILSMLQTIFNQAWALSSIQEFDSEDKNGFVGNIYSYYGCLITVASSMILFLNIPLATILYSNDFFYAWKYTGMLIIAHLFGGLSVCISGVFNAVKDTKTLAMTTVFGALANVLFNATLIPYLGIHGAVMSTMLSNMIVWAWRMYNVRKFIRLKINIKRDIASYALVIFQCLVGISEDHMYIIQFIICIIIIVIYKTELEIIFRKIIELIGKKV